MNNFISFKVLSNQTEVTVTTAELKELTPEIYSGKIKYGSNILELTDAGYRCVVFDLQGLELLQAAQKNFTISELEFYSDDIQIFNNAEIPPVKILKIKGPPSSQDPIEVDPSKIPKTVTELELNDVIIKAESAFSFPQLTKLSVKGTAFSTWEDFTQFFGSQTFEEVYIADYYFPIIENNPNTLPVSQTKIDYLHFLSVADEERNQQLIAFLLKGNIKRIFFEESDSISYLLPMFPAKVTIEVGRTVSSGRTPWSIPRIKHIPLSEYFQCLEWQGVLKKSFESFQNASSTERLTISNSKHPLLEIKGSLKHSSVLTTPSNYTETKIQVRPKKTEKRYLFSSPLAPFFDWTIPVLAPEREKIITFYCCVRLLEDALTTNLDKLKTASNAEEDSTYTAEVEQELLLQILFEYNGAKVSRLKDKSGKLILSDTSQRSAPPSQSPAQITLPPATDHSSQGNSKPSPGLTSLPAPQSSQNDVEDKGSSVKRSRRCTLM